MHIAPTASRPTRLDGTETPARVLVLGTRLASRDVIGLCRRLVAQAGSGLHVEQVVAAGLRKVWNADGTLTAINLGWDLVLMVESPARICAYPERYGGMARVLSVAARAAGARVALLDPPPGKRAEDGHRIRTAVEAAARASHAGIVPVGDAWRVALAVHPELPLNSETGRVTPLGAYLVACTIVRYVSGALLSALDLPGVPGSTIAFVHRVVKDVVSQMTERTFIAEATSSD